VAPWRERFREEGLAGLGGVRPGRGRKPTIAFEPGEPTLAVRCVEGNGEAQIAERNPVRPSCATGLLSEEVMRTAEEAW